MRLSAGNDPLSQLHSKGRLGLVSSQRQAPRLLRAQGLHALELLLSIRLACDSDTVCSEGINQNLKPSEPSYGYVSSNEQEEESGSSPEHLHGATMRDHYRRCVRERITDPENPMWREDLLRRLRRSLGKRENILTTNVQTRTKAELERWDTKMGPAYLLLSRTIILQREVQERCGCSAVVTLIIELMSRFLRWPRRRSRLV